MHDDVDHDPTTAPAARRGLALVRTSGVLSLAGGAIHAAAIGAHAEHRAVVVTFSVLAALQLGAGASGVAAHTRRRHGGLALGLAAVNAAAAIGWILAKTGGVPFIDGLGDAEPVQFADGLAAATATAAVGAAVMHLVAARRSATSALRGPAASDPAASPTGRTTIVPTGRPAAHSAVAALSILTLFAMSAASTHHHEGSDDHTHADGVAHATGDSHAGGSTHQHDTATVAPVPYDPTKPIDLGGVEGVTPQQQARAENLIAVTLADLPQFADWTTLEARGYHSIQDGGTGYEHYVNWDYLDDEYELDPSHPESVVFEIQPDGSKELVSAMFFAKPGTTLETVPDIGGALTQWHIHNDLCYVGDPPVVAGLVQFDGTCAPPARTLGEPRPMIHVWVVPHPCGPFAGLEGIPGGQVKEGETHLCDSAHGGHHS